MPTFFALRVEKIAASSFHKSCLDGLYVPNAFSPNLDGINDYFQMFPDCGVANLKNLAIVDRWGAVVYAKSTIDPQDPGAFWNGLINGKVAPSGVYIWQVEVESVDGSQLKLFGDVTLLR